eukprot:GHVL01012437.1.p1 GENE.GHVL01012437.1~~GHVL01012437.1.p1  ORF type:complete len:1254 (-),score=275.44 GHVL01012437.1:39-3800(-)
MLQYREALDESLTTLWSENISKMTWALPDQMRSRLKTKAKVMIVDTGVPKDLYGYINTMDNIKELEIPGNSYDDDNNGWPDDYHWDAQISKSAPTDDTENIADFAHGTASAAAVAPHAPCPLDFPDSNLCQNRMECFKKLVMNCVEVATPRVINPNGGTRLSEIIDALDYAVSAGVQLVVVPAVAQNFKSAILMAAMNELKIRGILVAFSSGNTETPGDTWFPNAWNELVDSMLTVSAFDCSHGGACTPVPGLTPYSEGKTPGASIGAAGVNVNSFTVEGEIQQATGSSLALVHAAAVFIRIANLLSIVHGKENIGPADALLYSYEHMTSDGNTQGVTKYGVLDDGTIRRALASEAVSNLVPGINPWPSVNETFRKVFVEHMIPVAEKSASSWTEVNVEEDLIASCIADNQEVSNFFGILHLIDIETLSDDEAIANAAAAMANNNTTTVRRLSFIEKNKRKNEKMRENLRNLASNSTASDFINEFIEDSETCGIYYDGENWAMCTVSRLGECGMTTIKMTYDGDTTKEIIFYEQKMKVNKKDVMESRFIWNPTEGCGYVSTRPPMSAATADALPVQFELLNVVDGPIVGETGAAEDFCDGNFYWRVRAQMDAFLNIHSCQVKTVEDNPEVFQLLDSDGCPTAASWQFEWLYQARGVSMWRTSSISPQAPNVALELQCIVEVHRGSNAGSSCQLPTYQNSGKAWLSRNNRRLESDSPRKPTESSDINLNQPNADSKPSPDSFNPDQNLNQPNADSNSNQPNADSIPVSDGDVNILQKNSRTSKKLEKPKDVSYLNIGTSPAFSGLNISNKKVGSVRPTPCMELVGSSMVGCHPAKEPIASDPEESRRLQIKDHLVNLIKDFEIDSSSTTASYGQFTATYDFDWGDTGNRIADGDGDVAFQAFDTLVGVGVDVAARSGDVAFRRGPVSVAGSGDLEGIEYGVVIGIGDYQVGYTHNFLDKASFSDIQMKNVRVFAQADQFDKEYGASVFVRDIGFGLLKDFDDKGSTLTNDDDDVAFDATISWKDIGLGIVHDSFGQQTGISYSQKDVSVGVIGDRDDREYTASGVWKDGKTIELEANAKDKCLEFDAQGNCINAGNNSTFGFLGIGNGGTFIGVGAGVGIDGRPLFETQVERAHLSHLLSIDEGDNGDVYFTFNRRIEKFSMFNALRWEPMNLWQFAGLGPRTVLNNVLANGLQSAMKDETPFVDVDLVANGDLTNSGISRVEEKTDDSSCFTPLGAPLGVELWALLWALLNIF